MGKSWDFFGTLFCYSYAIMAESKKYMTKIDTEKNLCLFYFACKLERLNKQGCISVLSRIRDTDEGGVIVHKGERQHRLLHFSKVVEETQSNLSA